MAVNPIYFTVSNEDSKEFTFDKPSGDYGKTPGITIADGSGGIAPVFRPDVDNGDGTMTGTIDFGAPITGDVVINIFDRA